MCELFVEWWFSRIVFLVSIFWFLVLGFLLNFIQSVINSLTQTHSLLCFCVCSRLVVFACIWFVGNFRSWFNNNPVAIHPSHTSIKYHSHTHSFIISVLFCYLLLYHSRLMQFD